MANIPDLMKAVGTYLSERKSEHLACGNGVKQESEDTNESYKDIGHRYTKLHPDIRPYAMMMRTCYMEFDPMSDRGHVLAIYARCIGSVIGSKIFLQDKNLNQIQVAIERIHSEIYFTHGWARLRDFYNIVSGAWVTLLYISPFILHLKICGIDGIEITYPVKNPPARLMLDKHIETVSLNAPIPYFVLPKVFTHTLEKTLAAADVTTGTLTLFWRGFCQNALPNEETSLTFIDWLGNTWSSCHLQFSNTTNMTCKISGQWSDICKVHRLAEGVVVKFGVKEAANNRTIYFKLSPFIGVKTTLYSPSTSRENKIFYRSQHYFML